MANKITTLLDLDTKAFHSGIKGFKTSITEADGLRGKFQAGWSSAMSNLKAHTAEMAAAAGAALVAFGVKAVSEFQNTALEAGKFAQATGLAVEESSRWMEVAGDVGVATETIETLFVRMNKAIGTGGDAFAEFGIEAVRAADGQVDVNATMLNAIDVLGQMEDPIKRAELAQKLFGRGYKDAAEIIFGSADDIKAKLDEVSKAKVINEAELEKARKFREQMDQLKDKLEDVTLTVGGALVPVLGDMAEAINDIDAAIDRVPGGEGLGEAVGDAFTLLTGGWQGVAKAAVESSGEQVKAAEDARSAMLDLADADKQLTASTNDARDAHLQLNGATLDLADADKRATTEANRLEQATKDKAQADARAERDANKHKRAVEQLERAWENLTKALDDRSSFLGISQAFDDIEADGKAAMEAIADGSMTAEQALRDQEQSLIDLKGDVVAYAQSVKGIPPETVSHIMALIDEGKLAEAEAALADLERTRQARLEVNVVYPNGRPIARTGETLKYASGTMHHPGGAAMTNETGKEIVEFPDGSVFMPDMPAGTKVYNPTQTAGMMTGPNGVVGGSGEGGGSGGATVVGSRTVVNLTVNAGMGTDGVQVGRKIKEALDAYYRAGGSR